MARIKPDTTRTCPSCRGTGYRRIGPDVCGLCYGTGRIGL